MQNLLAKVCQICPFCIARRKWPASLYGRFMKAVEAVCPFCRAYDRIHKGRDSG
ncbi:MAG: hypothetical protein ABIH23_23015 [bacterium]